MYGPDHVCTQHLLLAVHELLEEVYGDVVVWREEDADVAGEEIIDLSFALVFGLKFFG